VFCAFPSMLTSPVGAEGVEARANREGLKLSSHGRSMASHSYVRQASETRVLRRINITMVNLIPARADLRSSLSQAEVSAFAGSKRGDHSWCNRERLSAYVRRGPPFRMAPSRHHSAGSIRSGWCQRFESAPRLSRFGRISRSRSTDPEGSVDAVLKASGRSR
jgi:hypothetical protein